MAKNRESGERERENKREGGRIVENYPLFTRNEIM